MNSSSAVLNCQPPTMHHHSRRHCHGMVEFSYMDRRRLNHRDFPGLCSRANAGGGDGNRSSDSSEGFCENDGDIADMAEMPVLVVRRGFEQPNNCCDTDSQEGGGSESSSNSNVSLKNAQGSDQLRSNTSSETQSDTSDSSIRPKVSLKENGGACGALGASSLEYSEAMAVGQAIAAAVVVVGEPPVAVAAVPVAAPVAAPVAVPVVAPVAAAAPALLNGGGAVKKSSEQQESDLEKDPSRRPSKDESSSSSSDSPSGDEYNVYYYDAKAAATNAAKDSKPTDLHGSANLSTILGNLKKTEDPWDILFARAEGLYAHGHTREACILGVKLAEELLASPPDLMIEVPPMPVKGKRKKQQVNPASHQLTCSASATLAKCGFLCTVLAENPEYYNLAFRVGLFGLEMARPPASTKPLEVNVPQISYLMRK